MKRLFGKYILLSFAFLATMASCNQGDSTNTDESTTETRTPVTVTSVSYEPLQDVIQLNATSSFLQKSYVKSNLNGYVKKVNIKFGDYVHTGQPLFVLKTKEAEAIGNSVNKLDTSFRFSGVNSIGANSNGFVAELDHQPGDYVQDGEQLAVITDSRSFVFIMNVPYEDRPYVSIGKKVEVLLPDQERLQGTISSAMPMVDSVSQTQAYSIKVEAPHSIPQNLIAKVAIIKTSRTSAPTLPKASILSNETQTEYWVMKLINDSTAVKVPVKTGIASGNTVEILSPDFSSQDKIILSGNYGLADTAFVIASPAKPGVAN